MAFKVLDEGKNGFLFELFVVNFYVCICADKMRTIKLDCPKVGRNQNKFKFMGK